MGFQDFISARLYFPIIMPLTSTRVHPRRRIWKMVREKNALMRSSSFDIERHQGRQLHELLVFANRHCEFYRSRFAAVGLKEDGDLIRENLRYIPILTKTDLQQHLQELLPAGVDRHSWLSNSSGGSTGQTVSLMQDGDYREENSATAFVSDCMQGYRFGARVAVLWGGPSDTRAARRLRARLSSYLANRRLYDSFDMSPDRMIQYHRDMQGYRPRTLVAYASSAWLFARFLLDRGIKPTYPAVSIITSAETLTDEMRQVIESCFGVPVYNRYGSREVGCIASECSRRCGLHIHLDKYVEVLDPEENTTVVDFPGNIVVTLLSGRALPLIRYELGDVGVQSASRCGCGLNTPLLKKVLGRQSDFIVAPTGRIIHGEFFTHVFYGRANVRQFQFVQESPTCFLVRIVPNFDSCLPCFDEESIRREIKVALGPEAHLAFEYPEHIAPLPSGKFRFTISQIKDPVGTSSMILH